MSLGLGLNRLVVVLSLPNTAQNSPYKDPYIQPLKTKSLSEETTGLYKLGVLSSGPGISSSQGFQSMRFKVQDFFGVRALGAARHCLGHVWMHEGCGSWQSDGVLKPFRK